MGREVDRARQILRQHEPQGIVERYPEGRLASHGGQDAERRVTGGKGIRVGHVGEDTGAVGEAEARTRGGD